jgi:hypothetical protein
MAKSLFKLIVSASADIDTFTKPAPVEYFYRLNPAQRTSGTLTIPAASFTNSNGSAVTTITRATANNGYYQLFVNGVLQQTAMYTVASTQVVITQTSLVPTSAPITLAVNNFAPTSTAVVTVTT